MPERLSRQKLEAAHCWEADDQVPGRPAMTDFRRSLRYQQARWREAKGHPIGTQPISPRGDGKPARLIGSRLPLAYGLATGANFLSEGALGAARARTSFVEPHQSFDHQRLWADLLWSPTLAFNLFGDLAADLALADRAVHGWWPDAPGTVCDVRFVHSPGRFDPAYLGSLRAFDAAFILDLGDGRQGIVGIDVNYHEAARRARAKPSGRPRQHAVAERSGIFKLGAIDAVDGTDLLVMSLEHLLLLSMLQHPSGTWGWGRYVVVHPAGNADLADACARYQALLVDDATFSSTTVEDLIDGHVVSAQTTATLRERYIPGARVHTAVGRSRVRPPRSRA
jgi:hypothetical protein